MSTAQREARIVPRKFLRRREVINRTGLPSTTIDDYMAAGTFPVSIPLGPRTTGWLESEIDAWAESRLAARESRS